MKLSFLVYIGNLNEKKKSFSLREKNCDVQELIQRIIYNLMLYSKCLKSENTIHQFSCNSHAHMIKT